MENKILNKNEEEFVVEERKVPLDLMIKLLDNLIDEGIRIIYNNNNSTCHMPLNKDYLKFIKDKISKDGKIELIQSNEEDNISKIIFIDFIR